MRSFLYCLLFLLCLPLFVGASESFSLSKEYFLRTILGQKLFLWNIEYELGDEKGYRSLSLKIEFPEDSLLVKENKMKSLFFSQDAESYIFLPYRVCSTMSKSAKELGEIFKDQIRCVKNSRGSYPYILVIGENNNEILKELKDGRSNGILIPSSYDYKVVDQKKD